MATTRPTPGAAGNRKGTSFAQAHKPTSRLVFDKYDADGSDTINVSEFRKLCYDMGHFLSDQELALAIRMLDADGNGEISYKEFISWWQKDHRFKSLQPSSQEMKELAQISSDFQRFDKDQSGCVDVREFRLLYVDLVKKGMTKKTLAGTLEELDNNRDGKVSFNEYAEWILNQRRQAGHGSHPVSHHARGDEASQ
ncbi:hypothetical protein DFS34DRAFT_377095 [Phlyctochytrium arcticum]|nr:hypothetical protein DFS34DRAFT_377095 [Phlyctochytrium arcticum]